MPARKLPNSDLSRLSALIAAKVKLDADQLEIPEEKPPLSPETIARLNAELPKWESLLGEKADLLVAQNEASSNMKQLGANLRTMVSHYIQVMNLAISRGQAPIGMRASMGLDLNQKSVPIMRSYQDIAFWARAISRHLATQGEGEYQNVNPSAQDVNNLLVNFESVRSSLKPAKSSYDSKQEEAESMRPEIDDLIKDIWDEIEFYYRKRPISSIRRRAREYGAIYLGLEEEVVEDPDLVTPEAPEAPVTPVTPGTPGTPGTPVDPPVDQAPPVDEEPVEDPDLPAPVDNPAEAPALAAA